MRVFAETVVADAEERRREYLQFAAPASRGGLIGFFSQIARLELGVPVDAEPIREALTYVAARFDCSDFAIAGLLRLLYRYRQSPVLPAALRREIEAGVLGFKYWWDEPGRDPMCYWTENHQIVFHSDQLLAGQLFPDRHFTNTGVDGRTQAARALPRIRRWMDWRATFGFSEWLSNCYLDEDLIALVNLHDFAADPEIRRRAGDLIHLLLFELGIHSHQGVFGCTHGRTYSHMILGGREEPTASVSRLMFGTGVFNDPSCMSAIALATSSYRCPPVLQAIAVDRPRRLSLRERHGVEVEEAPSYGIGFDALEDGLFFWGMESFVHPSLLSLSLRMVEAYGIHEYPEVREAMEKYQRQLARQGGIAAEDTDPPALTEVNIHTFRTPDYSLSCAQDYRAGKAGYQQHIWQATLGIDAVVFTNQPGSEDQVSRPNYWAGNATLPRAVQHENVLVCLHRAGADALPPFSHAYFPRAAFDEVVDGDRWTFARKGRGFLALFSQAPGDWRSVDERGIAEWRAADPNNAWICEMGSGDVAAFSQFVRDVSGTSLRAGSEGVAYNSPSLGAIEFGWREPLRVAGVLSPLRGYRRTDSPYARAEFAVARFAIEHGERVHALDLGTTLTRRRRGE